MRRWLLVPFVLMLLSCSADPTTLVDRAIRLKLDSDASLEDYFKELRIDPSTCARSDDGASGFSVIECVDFQGAGTELEIKVEWRDASRTTWRWIALWLTPRSELRSAAQLRAQYFADWQPYPDEHGNYLDDPRCGYRLSKPGEGRTSRAVGVSTSDSEGKCGPTIRWMALSARRI